MIAQTYEELMKKMTAVHSRRFKRVICHIIQERGPVPSSIIQERGPAPSSKKDLYWRSQYLAIIIFDEATGRFVILRLSTFRKIVKWLAQKGFEKARRLNFLEKVFMDLRDYLNGRRIS